MMTIGNSRSNFFFDSFSSCKLVEAHNCTWTATQDLPLVFVFLPGETWNGLSLFSNFLGLSTSCKLFHTVGQKWKEKWKWNSFIFVIEYQRSINLLSNHASRRYTIQRSSSQMFNAVVSEDNHRKKDVLDIADTSWCWSESQEKSLPKRLGLGTPPAERLAYSLSSKTISRFVFLDTSILLYS